MNIAVRSNKKAQFAMEMVITIGVMLAIILLFNYFSRGFLETDIQHKTIKDTITKLARTADFIDANDVGSEDSVMIDILPSVEKISFIGNEIVLYDERFGENVLSTKATFNETNITGYNKMTVTMIKTPEGTVEIR